MSCFYFRVRLQARTPNVVAQIASLPPFQPTPHVANTPATSTTTTTTTTSSVTVQNRPVLRQAPAAAPENWFLTYDWLIALIVLAIAALVYRRFGGFDDLQKLS
jgi:hypothetical protein